METFTVPVKAHHVLFVNMLQNTKVFFEKIKLMPKDKIYA